jgi:WXG100 family type VII secretion target
VAGAIVANSVSIKLAAGRFNAASAEAARLVSTMQSLAGRLGGSWQGAASASFQSSMGQVKAQLDLVVMDLRDTGQDLASAAAAYEQFEQTIKGRIGQITV